LPQCHSLKEKRSTLRPLLEALRNRYAVSTAETNHHDTWQRATIGVAAVSSSVRRLEELADNIERLVWSFPELTVLDTRRSWLEEE